MPAAIAAFCRRTGQPVPEDPADCTRAILESLAFKYRLVLESLEELTGRPLRASAHRRRRLEKPSAEPADGRRASAGRCSRDRSRRRRSATSPCRWWRRARGVVGRGARDHRPIVPAGAIRAAGRRTAGIASTGDFSRTFADADFPLHHVLQRRALSGDGQGRRDGARAPRPHRRVPRGADLLRPDALQHGLLVGCGGVDAAVPRCLRRRGGHLRPLGLVRGDDPRSVPDDRGGFLGAPW